MVLPTKVIRILHVLIQLTLQPANCIKIFVLGMLNPRLVDAMQRKRKQDVQSKVSVEKRRALFHDAMQRQRKQEAQTSVSVEKRRELSHDATQRQRKQAVQASDFVKKRRELSPPPIVTESEFYEKRC